MSIYLLLQRHISYLSHIHWHCVALSYEGLFPSFHFWIWLCSQVIWNNAMVETRDSVFCEFLLRKGQRLLNHTHAKECQIILYNKVWSKKYNSRKKLKQNFNRLQNRKMLSKISFSFIQKSVLVKSN